jgi:mRNA interferase RelE/StbE
MNSDKPYSVVVSRPAQKDIRDLDQMTRNRVMRALRHLAAEPRPHVCRKLLTEENLWRVRVGDYRVIYSIDDASKVVQIIGVRHRSKAYE